MRKLFFKEKYLNVILNGKKRFEGRVGYSNIKRFQINDYVDLNGRFRAQIINIISYPTFKEALEEIDYKLLIPDVTSKDTALKIYNKLYPLWKQKKLGVYIFELKYPIKNSNPTKF